jgi:hypothetical protein
LSSIKSQRKEYGTPILPTINLPEVNSNLMNLNNPSVSNLHEDTMDLFDEEPIDSTIHNTSLLENELTKDDTEPGHSDNVRIANLNIKTGDPKDRFIDIDFGDHFDQVSKVLIITNDGHSNYFNPHTVNSSTQTIK